MRYLQQLVRQVGLDQPVVQGDVKELVLRPLCQTQHLLKLGRNHRCSLEMQMADAHSSSSLLTHMSRCFLIAEHVGVRGHDGWPRLLGDTGRLRGGFALVDQLLHGVCDALITGEPTEWTETALTFLDDEQLQEPLSV